MHTEESITLASPNKNFIKNTKKFNHNWPKTANAELLSKYSWTSQYTNNFQSSLISPMSWLKSNMTKKKKKRVQTEGWKNKSQDQNFSSSTYSISQFHIWMLFGFSSLRMMTWFNGILHHCIAFCCQTWIKSAWIIFHLKESF